MNGLLPSQGTLKVVLWSVVAMAVLNRIAVTSKLING